MSEDEYVTRREFDVLARAVERMDQQGTRGISALSVQMTEVIKDVADVQKHLSDFRSEHVVQHQNEAMSRLSARRWAIGTGIAFLTVIETPLLYLVAHIH